MTRPTRVLQAGVFALLGVVALVTVMNSAFAEPGDNLPPIASPDYAVTPQDTPVVIDVLANDADPDEDPLTIAPGALARASILAAAPVLFWECYPTDGGGVVMDRSGLGAVGIIGAGVQAGDPDGDCDGGNAFVFPGDPTAVVTGNSPVIPQGAVPRTVLVRFQATNPLAGDAALFSLGANSGNQQFSLARMWDNNQLYFAAFGNDTVLQLPPGVDLGDGLEHTLAVTYDGATTVTPYVDGVAGTPATLHAPLDTAGDAVMLGGTLYGAVGAGDQMRQFAVFQTALDASQIASIHAAITAGSFGQSVTQGAHGSVVSDGTSITYIPNPGFFGQDTFTYSVSDGQGGSASTTVTVDVTGGATAVPDNVTVTAGGTLQFDALANDVIPEGITASIVSVTAPENGTATAVDATTIEYVPDEEFIGTDSFTYVLETNEGNQSVGTVTVTVTPFNQDPVAVDDYVVTSLGQSVHIDVVTNDADPDGQAVYVSPGQLARGAILREGPLLHWECLPEGGASVLGDTSGNYRDGSVGEGVTPGAETGDCDNGTAMTFAGPGGVVTLDSPGLPTGNQARAALVRYKANTTVVPADIPLFGYGQNGTPFAQFTVSRAILGNDKLIFTSWANDLHFDLPPGANIADGLEHNIMFVYDGDVTVYAYYDGIPSGQGTLGVPLDTIDDTVMLGQSPWGWQSAGDEMRQFAIFPNAISEDDAYLVHAAIQAAVLNQSHTVPRFGSVVEDLDHLGFTYIPEPGFTGTDQFLYAISDGNGGGSIALVTIEVQPGVAANDDEAEADADTPVVIEVLANDSAQVGATLTIESVSEPENGTAEIVDGTIVYTPNEGFLGTDTFTYTVSSDQGGDGTGTVIVVVGGSGENQLPVANPDEASTAAGAPVEIDVLANDSDPDGDTLVISAGDSAIPGILGYSPVLHWACLPPGGSASMFDQSGNGRDGVVSGSVGNGPATADCGGGTSLVFPDATSVVSRTTPGLPEGAAPRSVMLRYRTDFAGPGDVGLFGMGTNAVGLGQFSIARTGAGNDKLVFASWGNDVVLELPAGADIADGAEHTIVIVYDGGTTLTAYVDGVPGAPASLYAPLDTVDGVVVLGQTAYGAVSAGAEMRHFAIFDRALDASEVGGLHAIIQGVGGSEGFTQPSNGSVVASAGGLTYSPNPGFSGIDTFTYTISDGNGGTATTTVTVTVSAGFNIADDVVEHDSDEPLAIDVLANDSPAPTGTLVIDSVSQGENGTVAIDGGMLVYTPAEGFTGTDTFTYTASDGLGNEDTATVTVIVSIEQNQSPVAVDDEAQTDAGTPVSIDVLANDSDADGDTISIAPGQTAIGALNAYAPSLYWACLPASGTTVADQSGNGLDGLIQGNVLAGTMAGDCGGASAVFADGSALILNASGAGLPEGADARTLVVRFRTDLTEPANVGIFGYGANAEPLGQFSIARTSAGNDRLIFASWGNDNVLPLPPGTDIADGQEHTIVITYDGANTITAWVDGVAGTPTTIAPLNTVNAEVRLGQTLYGAVSAGAEMRHFAIFPGALDGAAIASIHAAIEGGGSPAYTQGANGTVEQEGDQLVYTPAAGFGGVDTFTYTITDGEDTDSALVTVTVEGGAFSVQDDEVLTQQGEPTVIDALANDSGTGLVVQSISPPANGNASTDGATVTYTPDPDFHGTDTIEVAVSEGEDADESTWLTSTITVTVNGPPQGDDVAASTDIGTPVVLDILGGVTDPEGGALSIVEATEPGSGSAAVNSGEVTYTPEAGFTGLDSFTVTVTDEDGGTLVLTVIVTVSGNTPPVAVDDEATVTSGVPTSIDVRSNDSDADGDLLRIAPGAGARAAILSLEPSLLWECLVQGAGSVADRSGHGVTGSLLSVEAGAAPGDCDGGNAFRMPYGLTGVSADNPGLPEGAAPRSVLVRFKANFEPAGNIGLFGYGTNEVGLGQFSIARSGEGNDKLLFASWGNDGILELPAGTDLGDGQEHTIVIVYDGGTTLTAFVDGVAGTPLTIAPLATVDGEVVLGQTLFGFGSVGDEMRQFAVFPSALSDVEVAALHAAIEGASTAVALTQPANGTVTTDGLTVEYTSAPGYVGGDSFTYTISDGSGGTAVATVNVTVEAPALAPEDDEASTQQGQAVVIPVLDNDVGVDLQVTEVTDGANGAVTTDGTTVTYVPNPGFSGTDTFTVTVGNGLTTTTSTVTVTVNGTPVGEDLEAETEPETPVVIDVLATVTDPEGTALTVTDVTAPASGSVDVDGGEVTYTPAPGFTGTDTFEVTVTDEDGGSLVITVTVTVAPALVANDDTAYTQQGEPVVVAVLDNDEGEDLAVESVTQGADGSVTADGAAVTYTPDAAFWGTDTFEVTVTNGEGETATSTVTVTVNGAPVGEDITLLVQEDEASVLIPWSDAITDPEGGPLTLAEFTHPTFGIVSLEAGDGLFFAPDGGTGTATFQVTVGDADGGTVTINVTVDVNAAPIGAYIEASTDFGAAVAIDVLDGVTDPEGGALEVTDATKPANGTVTVLNGVATYTPNAGFSGTDSFEVTIEDENDGTLVLTVTVEVGTNSAPEGSNIEASTQQEEAVSIGVLGGFTDAEGHDLSIAGTTDPGNGSVEVDGDSVTYTPVAGFFGTDSFQVTVADEHGAETTITVTVTVNGAPVGADVEASTSEDMSVEIDILEGVTDPEGGALEVADVTEPANGAVTVLNGIVTYTPNAGFSGTDSFEVTVEDEDGGALTLVVTITVTPAPRVLLVTDACIAVVVRTGSATYTDEFWLQAPGAPSFLGITNLSADGTTVPLGTFEAGTELVFAIHVTNTGHVFSTGSAFDQPDGVVHASVVPGEDDVLYTVGFEDLFGGGDQDFDDGVIDVLAIDCAVEAEGDEATTDEDMSVSIPVLDNDATENGTLAITSVASPTNGEVTEADGVLTYAPNLGFTGTDSFTYSVENGLGGSDTATVTVTVTAAPRVMLSQSACVAVIVQQHGDVGYTNNFWLEAPGAPTALGINNFAIGESAVLGSFEAGTELVLSIHVANTGHVFQTGPAWRNADDLVHAAVTPGAGDVLYTVGFEDLWNGGDLDFDDAMVDVVVVDCDDVTAADDEASTDSGSPVIIEVLANDGAAHGSLQVTSVTQGADGAVATDGTTVTYTPVEGFAGTDTFTYTVSNGLGGSASASVTVEVAAGLAANDDHYSVKKNATAHFYPLENDQSSAGGLKITYVTKPSPSGEVSIKNNGNRLQFKPKNHFDGVVTFVYTVRDANGQTDTATVTVQVGDAHKAPEAADDTASTNKNQPVTIDVMANDDAFSGDDLSLVSVTQPPAGQGSAQIVSRKVRFTPASNFVGTTSFTYTVEDEHGLTDTATVTVTVSNTQAIVQGKMTGGGNYQKSGYKANWGMELRCSSGSGHFNFHEDGIRLHVNNLTFTDMLCSDDPAINNKGTWDTVWFIGQGRAQIGNWNQDVILEATLTDGGGNKSNDTFDIKVTNTSGTVILHITGSLTGGNHVAHKND